MNVLALINQGVEKAIQAAGDAIVTVLVAAAIEADAQPGEDYEPTWAIYDGKGFFEKTEALDFPDTQIQVTDRTLVVLQCSHDIVMHDYVKVGEKVYHVYGIKPDVVGDTRVLQKLLVRAEQKTGVPWESVVLAA
jgi:hypothetical protein